MVHADIEVEHDEDRRLQPVGEVEGGGGELERLGRVLGKQQHVLGVAVRGVGAGDDVGLLRSRRHAGRGAGPLHVENHRGYFREIGEAEELLHQRDAGAGGGGEGARAVPGRADHDADRGELVLGLHDGEFVLFGRRIDAHALAVARERLGERRRRRDRIPGADRRAAIDGAQGGGRIALDEDAVADRVGALEPQPDRVFEIHHRPVAAEMQRVLVGVEQLLLALVLFADERLELGTSMSSSAASAPT